jgi:hypothetical protein
MDLLLVNDIVKKAWKKRVFRPIPGVDEGFIASKAVRDMDWTKPPERWPALLRKIVNEDILDAIRHAGYERALGTLIRAKQGIDYVRKASLYEDALIEWIDAGGSAESDRRRAA